jgi:hypothetical protein
MIPLRMSWCLLDLLVKFVLSRRPTPQHDVEECLCELLVQGIIVPFNVYIWLTPRLDLTFLDFLL